MSKQEIIFPGEIKALRQMTEQIIDGVENSVFVELSINIWIGDMKLEYNIDPFPYKSLLVRFLKEVQAKTRKQNCKTTTRTKGGNHE